MRGGVLADFELNLVRLENKSYNYEFVLAPAFFNAFPDSLIEEGEGKALLQLDKQETMMQLHFHIRLKTELICDVSLKPFDYDIEVEKSIIVKFGPEDAELSEEMMIIADSTQTLNVASFIYEFVNLEVPMKRVHPDLQNEDRPDIAYTSKVTDDTEDTVDPRWQALKDLKEKK